ncbi:GGDEF domain-containing protein [Erwinia phyllosphaerae]|uniref:GGDEF domain-containing protein n=1 Tax=Erwinia phyllosphaerae TaxID=2853256 RepID=UPI001FEFF27B|nr:sensor domain-containing diguanylate cyclase [Erwinia phyllosphaerae]MBV4367723.1 sensor domain-containing diguanylate cyclase [Erwinia phyllosphaerae]
MSEEHHPRPDVSMHGLRRLLIIFLLVIGSAVVLVNGWVVYSIWQRIVNETQNDAHNLSQSLSRQSEDTILPVELTLQDLRDRITLVGLDPERQAYLRTLLMERKASLPQLHGLFVYDSQGNWVLTSEGMFDQRRNNADRAYFKYHQQHSDLDLHIDEVIRSRSTGDLIIPLSMRLNNRDGSFRGVLLATLRLDYFRQTFGYYNLGERGLLALMTHTGNILYVRPFANELVNRNISDSPLFKHLLKTSTSGTATYKAAVDGLERVFGYASLKRYPLVVAVGYDKQQLVQAWLTELVAYLTLCALLLAVIAALGWLLMRNIGHTIRDQEELAMARDRLAIMNRTLQTLALVDSLTGLANRRQFDLYLDRSLERANNLRAPLALLMIDVDSFKRFNDTYGHLAGDECLKYVGNALQSVDHHADDLIARYGGEEFAVILCDCEAETALRLAHAVREAVAALQIPHRNSENEARVVTISVGVHVIQRSQKEDRQTLISQADKALYQAKTGGRNRVEIV